MSDKDRRPNLQNIPIRTELGRSIREGLTRPIVLDLDYTDIERRMRENQR